MKIVAKKAEDCTKNESVVLLKSTFWPKIGYDGPTIYKVLTQGFDYDYVYLGDGGNLVRVCADTEVVDSKYVKRVEKVITGRFLYHNALFSVTPRGYIPFEGGDAVNIDPDTYVVTVKGINLNKKGTYLRNIQPYEEFTLDSKEYVRIESQYLAERPPLIYVLLKETSVIYSFSETTLCTPKNALPETELEVFLY